MKPSESHKQPAFVIPKKPFQEVGFVGVMRIVYTSLSLLRNTSLNRVTSIVLVSPWSRSC